MTYGCGAYTCLVCYPYEYACADCGNWFDNRIAKGEHYECEECGYVGNETIGSGK
jgi:uncharacterized Zn finger protein